MVLVATLCIAVTLLLLVLLIAARRAMRTEHHGWIERRLDDDIVLWHQPGWDERTQAAAEQAIRRARGRAGAEH